jgi:broad specificity phosphatase PhoE
MLKPRPFFYLRHGETDWNRDHRAQGQTDVPLNERGLAQAHAAKALLQRCEVATICVSPLRRAHDTALIVNEDLGRPIVVIDELKEVGFGAAEGTSMREWVADWRRGTTPQGAETYPGFIARALRGINAALAHGGPVLIVAHGGVYWAIQEHARIEREEALPNCVPIRHDPPAPGLPCWRATIVA